MRLRRYDWGALTASGKEQLLRRPAVRANADIAARVRNILRRVRDDGDTALRELTRELDGAALSNLVCTEEELNAAHRDLDRAAVAAIDRAIANVTKFHEAQLPARIRVETSPGVVCERLPRPIDTVGLYVPSGSAPLPSAAIMLAVPARLAGCPVRVLATPPRSDGSADPGVLVAASRAGIDRIVKLGGAQAVAAMAYGTESVARVDKIFGPGNAWVTSAKAQVASEPGGPAIDMPAGPSELMVLTDDSADVRFVVSDLLAQAEHGPDSQVMLVTTSVSLAEAAADEVGRQLAALPRAPIATEALETSAILIARNRDEAVAIANRYAPEHLIVQMRDARGLLDSIRNAGSVFIGPWTPESVGDYCSGTNHVLPTYGYARAYSGLGVEQFQRQMTVQELNPAGLSDIGPVAVALARLEGLEAHARAVTLRLESLVRGEEGA